MATGRSRTALERPQRKGDSAMSTETIVRSIGDFASRRRFLSRLGAAGVASALYVGGVRAQEAQAACFEHGCNLCNPCTNGCGGYTCSWCWWGSCHKNPSGGGYHRTLCCEGFGPVSSCGPRCNNGWVCSFYGGSTGC